MNDKVLEFMNEALSMSSMIYEGFELTIIATKGVRIEKSFKNEED